MKRFFLAFVLTFAMAVPAGSSVPPPPPPPPDDLPESYDGYSTEMLWYAYLNWVRAETFERRKKAFEALDWPQYNDDPDGWETRLKGPRYESTSYWIPFGRYFAFENICPSNSADDDPACRWRYRSAYFDAGEADVHGIVFDTFDGAAFAEYLREQGVTPDAVTREYRSAFGLAETVDARLDALIVSHDVRQSECPAIGEMIARLAQRTIPLSPLEPAPDPSSPPEPPLPPGADSEQLTFPLGYFPYADATMTVSGRGSPALRELASMLTAPVNACIGAAEN